MILWAKSNSRDGPCSPAPLVLHLVPSCRRTWFRRSPRAMATVEPRDGTGCGVRVAKTPIRDRPCGHARHASRNRRARHARTSPLREERPTRSTRPCAPPDRWDPQTPPSEDATVPILPPALRASRLFLQMYGYTICYDRLQSLCYWYAMIPMPSLVVKVYLNTQLPTWHACDKATRYVGAPFALVQQMSSSAASVSLLGALFHGPLDPLPPPALPRNRIASSCASFLYQGCMGGSRKRPASLLLPSGLHHDALPEIAALWCGPEGVGSCSASAAA